MTQTIFNNDVIFGKFEKFTISVWNELGQVYNVVWQYVCVSIRDNRRIIRASELPAYLILYMFTNE